VVTKDHAGCSPPHPSSKQYYLERLKLMFHFGVYMQMFIKHARYLFIYSRMILSVAAAIPDQIIMNL